MPNQILYNILGVARDATQAQIRAAYLKLAKQWHPDRNPGNEADAERRFKEIAHAYDVLSDPARRAEYDVESASHANTAERPQDKNYEKYYNYSAGGGTQENNSDGLKNPVNQDPVDLNFFTISFYMLATIIPIRAGFSTSTGDLNKIAASIIVLPIGISIVLFLIWMIEISARSAWQKKRKIDINWLKFSPVVFLLFFTSLVAGWGLPAVIDKKPESEKITVAASAAPITESAETEPSAGQGPAVGTERIEVTFSSEPAGAVIIIDGENFGIGPVTISYGVPEGVSADYNLNVPGGYAVWPDGQKSQVISYFTLSLQSPRSDFVFTSLAPKAGLGYSASPFQFDVESGIPASPFNPTLPSMPRTGGLSDLDSIAADSAADQLAVVEAFRTRQQSRLADLMAPPRRAPTPVIGVSAAGDELYVQGRRFNADDAQAALEAEATLSGAPVGQLPAGFRAIDTDTYAQYMKNIRAVRSYNPFK